VRLRVIAIILRSGANTMIIIFVYIYALADEDIRFKNVAIVVYDLQLTRSYIAAPQFIFFVTYPICSFLWR
jgi:hypothetical protein